MENHPLLERLKSEIAYDKLTLSFSLESKGLDGVRRFSSFSASVVCSSPKGGWTPAEMPLVKALASKQVVAQTYLDALHRKVITRETYVRELKEILGAMDAYVSKTLDRVEEG